MASIKIPVFALKLVHQVVKVPAVQIAVKKGQFYTKALGGMAGYAIPAGIFAGWMVFPALGDDARGAIGLGPVKEVPSGIRYEYEDGAHDTMPVVKK